MSAAIHIDADWRSLFHYGEELCGDRVMMRRNDEAFVMVLADGLGSGVKANILSTLTSTIISEMIFEGLTLHEAVETIASTLPVCADREVAYSTFTILKINYITSKAYLAQYDNPLTVFIRDSQIMDIPRNKVVIDDKIIWESQFDLKPDDHIIFFSDGILYADTEMQLNLNWGQKDVEAFLSQEIHNDDPARECTRILLAMVNSLYGGKPSDDCTVAAVRIFPCTETVVMAGPPADPKDDETVMKRLMNATGQKIVCGGTTSSIAARFLGKELRPSLDFFSKEIPPTAELEGVDLVTEGVITVNKVVEYAKDFLDKNSLYEEWSFGRDGASRIAQLLFEEATDINFYVGKAVNPAHQNPDLPINFNIKMNLVKELSKCLTSMGKNIKVSYF